MTSLLDAIREEGFHLESGIACTYSVDETTFSALEKTLGVCYDKDSQLKFGKGEIFRLYAQWDHAPVVHNAVRGVCLKNGVLHAKVYVLKFSDKKGAKKYKIVVASANLTNSDELNVYVSFTGKYDEETESTFGKSVSEFFIKRFNPQEEVFKSLLSEICSVGFDSDESSFFDVNPGMIQNLKCDNVCTIISPFLSKEIIKHFPHAEVISRKDQLDAELSSLDIKDFDGTVKVLNTQDDMPDTLHAKVYIGSYWVYLGSANATAAAFSQNIEALVRFPKEKALYLNDLLNDWTSEYTLVPSESEHSEQKALDNACRKILSGFKYDLNVYKFDIDTETFESYNVTFMEKEVKSPNSSFERSKKNIHTVKLDVTSRQDESFSKSVSLLIDGEPLPYDEKDASQESEQAIIDELFNLGKRAVSADKIHKQDSSTSKTVKSNPQTTLVESLRSIRTANELKSVRDNARKFLETFDNQVLKMFLDQTEGIVND